MSGVMMQFFHWYIEPDGQLWNFLKNQSKHLSDIGITAVWMPPAMKGNAGGLDNGYTPYDLYDLGEFEQKQSLRTKYGTKEEYLDSIKALHDNNIQAIADIPLNHLQGGDEKEIVNAMPFSKDDRSKPCDEMREVEVYTHFKYDARGGKYSDFQFRWYHFNAIDYDDRNPEENNLIYVFESKHFNDNVSKKKGNYDYLLGADLDVEKEDVKSELQNWGRWYLDTTEVDGFRFDAAKHISFVFLEQWFETMKTHKGKDFFAVAEFWDLTPKNLVKYIDDTKGKISLFDVRLHYNFHEASKNGSNYDLRTIFENTLISTHPQNAVTFAANHDTQPMQKVECVVEPWFKPHAYTLMLLRHEGYPCIFFGDYYGATYKEWGEDGNEHEVFMANHGELINKLLGLRKDYLHGEQIDYFDHKNCVAWSLSGNEQNPGSMVVIMSNGENGYKDIDTHKPNTKYVEATGNIQEEIYTDENAKARFWCNAGNVAIWVESQN